MTDIIKNSPRLERIPRSQLAAQVSAHNCTLGSISLGYISFGTLTLLASQKTIKPPLFGSKYLYNSPLLASNLVSSLEKDPHSDGWFRDQLNFHSQVARMLLASSNRSG